MGVYAATSQKVDCKYESSDGEYIRVSIDMIRGMIGWERTYPTYLSIANIRIPETMRNKQLYPYIEFSCSFEGAVTVL
jgi:hypothetical protein